MDAERNSSSNKMRVQYLVNEAIDNVPKPATSSNPPTATKNGGESSFECDICQQTYSLRGNLNKHIKTVHKKSRPHACDFCDADFAFSDGLRRHVNLVHVGTRPFRCDTCDATFKQRSHLAKHRNSAHKTKR